MKTKTFKRRCEQLLQQVQSHPHKDELLNLMLIQIRDDVDTASILSRSTH